jgi:hypothetical protein
MRETNFVTSRFSIAFKLWQSYVNEAKNQKTESLLRQYLVVVRVPLRASKYENIGWRRNLNFYLHYPGIQKFDSLIDIPSGCVIIYETLYLIRKQHSGITDGNI